MCRRSNEAASKGRLQLFTGLLLTPFLTSFLEMLQLMQFCLRWKRNCYMKQFKHFALYHFGKITICF